MSNTRRNCILVLTVKENESEDTDAVMTETLNDILQEKNFWYRLKSLDRKT